MWVVVMVLVEGVHAGRRTQASCWAFGVIRAGFGGMTGLGGLRGGVDAGGAVWFVGWGGGGEGGGEGAPDPLADGLKGVEGAAGERGATSSSSMRAHGGVHVWDRNKTHC